MFIGVGVSCCLSYFLVSYLYVSFSGLDTSAAKERTNRLLVIISVRSGFLFLLVLGIGCVISLWHSLGLLYNYFVVHLKFL